MLQIENLVFVCLAQSVDTKLPRGVHWITIMLLVVMIMTMIVLFVTSYWNRHVM